MHPLAFWFDGKWQYECHYSRFIVIAFNVSSQPVDESFRPQTRISKKSNLLKFVLHSLIPRCHIIFLASTRLFSFIIMQGLQSRVTISETNLPVLVSSTFKTRSHSNRACASTWGMLGSILRSFGRLAFEPLTASYTSHVRPLPEYGRHSSFLYTKGEVMKLETLQWAATRMIVGLRGFSYERRLQATGLFPVQYEGSGGI